MDMAKRKAKMEKEQNVDNQRDVVIKFSDNTVKFSESVTSSSVTPTSAVTSENLFIDTTVLSTETHIDDFVEPSMVSLLNGTKSIMTTHGEIHELIDIVTEVPDLCESVTGTPYEPLTHTISVASDMNLEYTDELSHYSIVTNMDMNIDSSVTDVSTISPIMTTQLDMSEVVTSDIFDLQTTILS